MSKWWFGGHNMKLHSSLTHKVILRSLNSIFPSTFHWPIQIDRERSKKNKIKKEFPPFLIQIGYKEKRQIYRLSRWPAPGENWSSLHPTRTPGCVGLRSWCIVAVWPIDRCGFSQQKNSVSAVKDLTAHSKLPLLVVLMLLLGNQDTYRIWHLDEILQVSLCICWWLHRDITLAFQTNTSLGRQQIGTWNWPS